MLCCKTLLDVKHSMSSMGKHSSLPRLFSGLEPDGDEKSIQARTTGITLSVLQKADLALLLLDAKYELSPLPLLPLCPAGANATHLGTALLAVSVWALPADNAITMSSALTRQSGFQRLLSRYFDHLKPTICCASSLPGGGDSSWGLSHIRILELAQNS